MSGMQELSRADASKQASLLTVRVRYEFVIESVRGELEQDIPGTFSLIGPRRFTEEEACQIYRRLRDHFDPEPI